MYDLYWWRAVKFGGVIIQGEEKVSVCSTTPTHSVGTPADNSVGIGQLFVGGVRCNECPGSSLAVLESEWVADWAVEHPVASQTAVRVHSV